MIETEQETDGRWIAEVPALPGVLAYGETPAEARARAEALALRVLAERIEHGEPLPGEAAPSLLPRDDIGPAMMGRIAKHTGLQPGDL